MVKKIVGFGIVGILATLIDYVLLFSFREFAHFPVLTAATFSFTISLVFNYYYSMKYVFINQKEMGRKKQITIFFITAIVGYFINQFIMWVCIDYFNIYYMFSKVLATLVVMIFNFISRHVFLEE
ncbi:MAG: GtrA family protein [Bacilli bacterium]